MLIMAATKMQDFTLVLLLHMLMLFADAFIV